MKRNLNESAHRESRKRAALYTRVSTDEQAATGYSLPTQLAGCRKYAAAHGFAVVAELTDDCSGAIPFYNRPQGKKLYDLIDHGALDAVIIFTHDRTARDERVLEYLLLKAHLAEHNVELHYTDTGLDPYTMEGNLIGYIKAHAAADERRKIGERSARGRLAKAQDGKLVLSGYAPFGYTKTGKGRDAQLQINETEAEAVRAIFHSYGVGDPKTGPLSLRSIGLDLQKKGIKPPNHRKSVAAYWLPATLTRILSNSIYAGRWFYGKTRLVKHGMGKAEHVQQPRDQQIGIDVPELAIVSPEVWEAAQAQLKRNKSMPPKHRKHDYLLSGFVRCGACGRSITGSTNGTYYKGKRYEYPAYRCGNHWNWNLQRCPNENVHYSWEQADTAVWQWFKGLLEDEKKLEKGLNAMEKQDAAKAKPQRQRLGQIQKRITELERSIDCLVQGFGAETDATISASVKNQMRTYAEQIENLRAERQSIETELNQKHLGSEVKDRIRKQAAGVRKRLANPNYQQKRALFQLFNLSGTFSVDKDKRRWLEVKCAIYAQGLRVPLPTNWGMIYQYSET